MSSLRVHVLQHTVETPPGSVLDWLKARGHAATVVRLWNGDALPSVDETDWLIVLGGRMSVGEVTEYPWLAEEKKLLREAVAKNITCLGLCLGGQLLAETLGASVHKNTEWEVGWHTVHVGNGADPESRLMAFHWHEDVFELPPKAIRVATSRVTPNQGFTYGDRIVGLQFHPEATEEWIRSNIDGSHPMPPGDHVQTPQQIEEGLIFLTPLRKWFFDLLNRLESITLHHK